MSARIASDQREASFTGIFDVAAISEVAASLSADVSRYVNERYPRTISPQDIRPKYPRLPPWPCRSSRRVWAHSHDSATVQSVIVQAVTLQPVTLQSVALAACDSVTLRLPTRQPKWAD